MKHLLFILFLLPLASFAQTQKDYEHTMARFVKFYNQQQGDSIQHLWPPDMAKMMTGMWGNDQVAEMHKDYGKIRSVKYLGMDPDEPGLAVFKTQFSKEGWKTTSLTLDDKHNLGTFRFITSSDGIDKLLKAEK